MESQVTLSAGMKIFIACVVLLMAAAAVATIVWIVGMPVWKSSVIDGGILAFTLLFTVGLTEWLFTEIILDIIKTNKK